MSVYLYFHATNNVPEYSPEHFLEIINVEEGEEEIVSALLKENKLKSDDEYDYRRFYRDENSWSSILEFVYKDAVKKLDLEQNDELLKLLWRPTNKEFRKQLEPYLCYYTKEEVDKLHKGLLLNIDALKSTYLDLYLEILNELVRRQSGLVVIWV